MKEPKLVAMLRLAKHLSDSSPRRWSALELARDLGLHQRSVHRYLLHLDPVMPICHAQGRYWLEGRSWPSEVS